ncbi:hypothetical protein [Streptomyces sp. ISL-11]|uniref:hypothetical protein n=1 Tax=Streptomyces sp. ISL-11 TaxID=2819174 RepID=UPI001BE8D782|nr:hypothetical protein [Streptomyces sp. ISL-11]MBT2383578.1 hypothetical protein [Streptomyces sp. ISL-11]
MEPLTEHRRVSGPVVYGFLRLINISDARQAALSASLAEYCHQHELSLCGVFTECTTVVPSGAFTGLMDVLELPDTYGVVLPAMSHLGPRAIATGRGKRIAAAGARLLLVRGDKKPSPPHHGLSGPAGVLSRHRGRGPAPALEAES